MSTKCSNTDLNMSLKKLHIYVLPHHVLHMACAEIESFDKRLQVFAKKMRSFMKRKKGIGLAAPQVGFLQRIITVGVHGVEQVLVNPSIVPITTDSDTKMEGCLSIPNESFSVNRSFQIEVRARDAEGKRLHFAANDLLARVIQHEVDHLDGVLICDKKTDSFGECERGIGNANI